jgi:hypothetical protein
MVQRRRGRKNTDLFHRHLSCCATPPDILAARLAAQRIHEHAEQHPLDADAELA